MYSTILTKCDHHTISVVWQMRAFDVHVPNIYIKTHCILPYIYKYQNFFTQPLFSLTHLSNSQLKKREESLSLPSFHGCLLIPPNCAALRTVRMCCKTSLTARLMLRPHGLMVGKQGSDSSYPGTPATSFYDPQSPPSARWHRSIIRMSEEETKC